MGLLVLFVYSDYLQRFASIHMCVDTEMASPIKRDLNLREENEKEEGGTSASGLQRGGMLPRSRCVKQHNLFSKKYIQSHIHVHLQATAQISHSSQTCPLQTL